MIIPLLSNEVSSINFSLTYSVEGVGKQSMRLLRAWKCIPYSLNILVLYGAISHSHSLDQWQVSMYWSTEILYLNKMTVNKEKTGINQQCSLRSSWTQSDVSVMYYLVFLQKTIMGCPCTGLDQTMPAMQHALKHTQSFKGNATGSTLTSSHWHLYFSFPFSLVTTMTPNLENLSTPSTSPASSQHVKSKTCP